MYPLSKQHRDLELYLASVPRPKVEVLRVWRQMKIHHTYAPEHVDCSELNLFTTDLDALVEVMWNEAVATSAIQTDKPAIDWRVRCALRWMEEQRGAPALTLKQAANGLRTSAQHLGRLFRKQVGRSFKDHLRSVRLRNALDLLAKPELSVKEIAAALGYSHQTHFTTEFRLAFGTTPARYRHRLVL